MDEEALAHNVVLWICSESGSGRVMGPPASLRPPGLQVVPGPPAPDTPPRR